MNAAVMTLMVLAGLAMVGAAIVGATATTMDTVILMVAFECIAAVVVVGLAGLSSW